MLKLLAGIAFDYLGQRSFCYSLPYFGQNDQIATNVNTDANIYYLNPLFKFFYFWARKKERPTKFAEEFALN